MVHAAPSWLHQIDSMAPSHIKRRAFCILVVSTISVGYTAGAQGAYEEFDFHSKAARRLLQQVRNAHGLTTPQPLALLGTAVRGDMTDRVVVVIDATGKYKRGGATIQGARSASRLTGAVTHFLDRGRYWKIPEASPAIAAVARPRLEREFNLASVTTLLRPPPGVRMTVRVEPPAEFNGERMSRLLVTIGEETVCTLFVRTPDGTLAGWSTMAETSAGMMPRLVVVESARTVDGVRVPIVLREQTGATFGSLTKYTSVLTGEAALAEFAREGIRE